MDKDLQSIKEVRDLLVKAKEAQTAFRAYSQEQVDAIVKAMADAGFAEAERLGRMAHEETEFGKPEDKKKKNEFATKRVWESIKDLKTVGIIREDREKKIVEIGEPMGVVAALVPSTNPTSTVMFKAIISVKGRNGFVASPHPKAAKCTVEALRVVADAAYRAGAPLGLLGCLSVPTLEGTNELMKHKLTSIILATGSNPMVRAAYSSGKPAYGVGSGNVPAFIERTANIPKAVADIISGKQFDYGVLCSTESGVIVDAPIREQVVAEFKKRKAYFVNEEEKEKLSSTMFDIKGALNPGMVGKSPSFIAHAAGINAPTDTSVLIAELPAVGREYNLSREKLSPVLSFFTVDGWREGCHRCIEMLEFGGIGHTMVIHSTDNDIILKFALEKPACRILANTQSALGAVGYTNELLPSLTLGPGTFGRSIISENVSAKHLINIKRLAYETRPINQAEGFSSKNEIKQPAKEISKPQPVETQKSATPTSWIEEIEERIRLKAGNAPVTVKAETHSPEQNSQKEFSGNISKEKIDELIKKFSK
ncbi:MAG: aldehyde dehydrogenase family protein [Bacteroidetes bacterium]|nr:aldehyde dehydrogenase family protein [Bacteroidota bacterium]